MKVTNAEIIIKEDNKAYLKVELEIPFISINPDLIDKNKLSEKDRAWLCEVGQEIINQAQTILNQKR